MVKSFFIPFTELMDYPILLISVHGRNVKTVIENPLDGLNANDGKNTVAYEARLIKYLLLKVQEY